MFDGGQGIGTKQDGGISMWKPSSLYNLHNQKGCKPTQDCAKQSHQASIASCGVQLFKRLNNLHCSSFHLQQYKHH
ncbi:hypothetical protein Pcinc_041290 [Petrolisthes cinctipes]|uniref:Uncharacterized protein n=1 Tax=Petrolisthes cinctipes TaxID=88211 RepID=A0AAE1BJU5_PETCI|nr:hypothetical protein Pcinc_041290 [Petrolisthes cinctipes]